MLAAVVQPKIFHVLQGWTFVSVYGAIYNRTYMLLIQSP